MLHRLPGLLQGFSVPFRTSGIFGAPKNARNVSSATQNIARSIRSALHNGDINSGYHIFTHNYLQSKGGQNSVKEALKNRYLAHVLLHTLHKSNQPRTAITFAELCLNRGIRVNRRSFESVFNRIVISRPSLPTSPPPSLTAAISLLAAARKSGHRHHSWMYDRIINALLLQGEVLTAALLFCTIVKEWNRWRSQHGGIEDVNTDESATKAPHDSSHIIGESLNLSIPAPNELNMIRILEAIKRTREHSMKNTQNPSSDRGTRALSALVPLLEHDCSVVPGRWRLLRALYRTNSAISERFNAAILMLFADLDTRGFDLASYHILLQYSLRERRSLELSGIVTRALCKAYTPSIVTYNIILREAARRGMNDLFNDVNRLLITSSSTASSFEITKLLSCYSIPKPDEFTLVAQMSEAISSGRALDACQTLVHIFPTLKYKAPTHSDARHDGRSVVRKASRFSAQFWTTATHAASKANSLTLSTRIWRLVMRAERNRHEESQESAPLFGKEAYTILLHFLHNTLSSLHRKSNLMAQSNPEPTSPSVVRLLRTYDNILKIISDVLVSFCDKFAYQALPLDAAIINALFSLVENVLLIERLFHISPSSLTRLDDRVQAICHRTQPHFGRILNSARNILVHYSIEIPKYLKDLGFRERRSSPIADSKLHLQPSILPYGPIRTSAPRIRRHKFNVEQDRNHSPVVYEQTSKRNVRSYRQTPESGIS